MSNRFSKFVILTAVLVLVMGVFSVTVAQDMQYSEAPSLAEMVAAGSLPPVEERLPENPLVMPVVNEIGTYGGVIRRGFTGPSDYNNYVRINYDALVRWNATGDTIVPHIAEAVTPNEDFTVWTVDLREGARWSDGELFTSEDIMFWVDGVAFNTDLNPTPPAWVVSADGTPAVITAPDEYTVTFEYAATNTAFLLELANKDGADRTIAPFLPAHYMAQFHPDYTDAAELDAKVAEAGFTTWTELFTARVFPPDNPERPAMAAWVPVSSLADQTFRLARNPYYFAVDPNGQQLPYIDEVVMTFFADRETLNLAAIAGEIDLQGRHINTTNYPVLLENADANGYRAVNLPAFGGSFIFLFNMTFEDMAYRELFNVDAFRQALSVAMDREAINELVWLGLAEPRQPVPPSFHPYYPGDEAAFAFTQYDPELANQLLDEAGLTNRDSEGFRTLPNGDRLTIVVEGMQGGQGVDTLELVRNTWQEVGVRTEVNLYERSLYFERSNANQHMISFWQMDTSAFPFSGNPKTQPSRASGITDFGRLWILWYQSGGTQGEEPPQAMKDLEALHVRGQNVGPEEQVEIAQEIYSIWGPLLYHIGTVGNTPNVFVMNANLRNIPEVIGNDWPLRTPGNANPEQMFYAQ
ncbi:MAG: ABC transporter substrate-binding protein [Anaerolineae bacterium]